MTDDIRERERRVASALPYVTHLARQVAATLPGHVALDDLVAAGREGLLDAATRFDPARGVRFLTYAHYRIRGAILDHVREHARLDVVHRARVSAESAIDEVLRARAEEGAPAGDAADAARSLGSALEEMAAACTLAEMAAATTSPFEDPEEAAMRAQQGQFLTTTFERMPERERAMLQSVYLDGCSIEEAGARLGLSKSWASRLHARALAVARDLLGDVALEL